MDYREGGRSMGRVLTVTVQLDTPLLQGGPTHLLEGGGAKGWTLDDQLRESQVKGLLHTFARALLLPLLEGDFTNAKHAERLLLGAPSGMKWKRNGQEEEYGKVVFIETSGPNKPEKQKYPNRPGGNKSSRQGLKPDQTCTITFHLMPWVPEPETHLKALWAVLWTGLCFGGIGIRSRRGYGGLTPIAAGPEETDTDNHEALSLFESPPVGKQSLAVQLTQGFSMAQKWVHAWVQCQPGNGLTLAHSPSLSDDPFQMAGIGQLFIGEPKHGADKPWEAVMKPFMDASSQELRNATTQHKEIIGAAGPRLASPVWLRIFKTNRGYVPVITLGANKTFTQDNGQKEPKAIVQALLTLVDAKPIEEVLKKASAGGAP